MNGQSALSRTSETTGARMYRIEVQGMSKSGQMGPNAPIRKSGSIFIAVPYKRMSEEVQHIIRAGGKIASIAPLTSDANNNHGE
ncbi:CpcD/allophycocyanin linker domain protein [Rubidibacter lacunae KORDI 51-2]|uniref:CpcD/allophycocyanin linker domain protein n=1 Tax=Rubidibacter lacunae KORDI 51-2 TaxID=582515 RepID=U5DMX5_9CHRO|nr:phycobilisome linker polypeptide [Rubidibacter lacunae]ERN41969.1 CpcD/allophycocyanin linker domain protein [Rubidibacter lacunae KORDI 51-2]